MLKKEITGYHAKTKYSAMYFIERDDVFETKEKAANFVVKTITNATSKKDKKFLNLLGDSLRYSVSLRYPEYAYTPSERGVVLVHEELQRKDSNDGTTDLFNFNVSETELICAKTLSALWMLYCEGNEHCYHKEFKSIDGQMTSEAGTYNTLGGSVDIKKLLLINYLVTSIVESRLGNKMPGEINKVITRMVCHINKQLMESLDMPVITEDEEKEHELIANLVVKTKLFDNRLTCSSKAGRDYNPFGGGFNNRRLTIALFSISEEVSENIVTSLLETKRLKIDESLRGSLIREMQEVESDILNRRNTEGVKLMFADAEKVKSKLGNIRITQKQALALYNLSPIIKDIKVLQHIYAPFLFEKDCTIYGEMKSLSNDANDNKYFFTDLERIENNYKLSADEYFGKSINKTLNLINKYRGDFYARFRR